MESVVEPNPPLSCEAPSRGAPDYEQASNLRVVAEPQPWHGNLHIIQRAVRFICYQASPVQTPKPP